MADGKVTISTELDNSGIDRDLKDAKKEAKKAGDAVEDYGDEFTKAGKKSRSAASDVEDDLKGIKKTSESVGDAIGKAFAVDRIIDFVLSILDTTEELSGDLSILDTNAKNAGIGLDTTREAMQRLNTVSGEADSSVEAVSNLLAAGVPENKMQAAVEGLSNAVIMFPDTLKIESLADSLQETLATGQATGQFGELLDRLGIGAENFSNQLALATTESEKLDMALSVLNSGSLNGVYEGWAEANPGLVKGRDASFELQEAMVDLGNEIRPIVADFTELAASVAGFVAHNVDVERLFDIVISGAVAIGTYKVASTIYSLVDSISSMDNAARLAQANSFLLVAAIGALVYAGIQVSKAWDDMSGVEKVIAILGLLTAAAFTAAVAVGAFQSAATLGIAAIAIAAGITAVLLAVNSAQKRADAAAKQSTQVPSFSSGGIPQLATGAVIPPNGQFLAVLGDQRHGRNLEAPEGLIRQIVREESGAGGGTLRISPGPGFTRYLKYELEQETVRSGKPLVRGNRR